MKTQQRQGHAPPRGDVVGAANDICAWPNCTRRLGSHRPEETWHSLLLISQNAVIEAILKDEPITKFLLETPKLSDCMLCREHAEHLASLLNIEDDAGTMDP